MNFSILDNKIVKLDANHNLPLSEHDTKKLDSFFDQGTFNQKLDRIKDDVPLTLDNGGFDLMQQRMLGHLHAMQEKFNALKNNDESRKLISSITTGINDNETPSIIDEKIDALKNNPYASQIFKSIENNYELLEQNFQQFSEKTFEKESVSPSELDQENNNFSRNLISASKELLSNIDNISAKNNNSALVNRFDKVVKYKEELYENKVNVDVSNHVSPENEKTSIFTPN